MKKLLGLMMCSLLFLVACKEAKADVKEQSTAPKQVTETSMPKQAMTAPATETPKVTVVNIDWAKALEMQSAGAMLIDVRTPSEVAEGTAKGSINIPLQEAEQRIAEFPKDKDLVVFCRSGKRSMAVSNFLISNGYERVFNVVGGFLAFPAGK